MAYAIISGVSFLLTPLYLLRSVPAENRARVILLFAALTAGFALVAWLMHSLEQRAPFFYLRRKSLPLGRGLRLVVERENVTLPTSMGGTMSGGSRFWIYAGPEERSRTHKLCRATAEPGLHEINCILARTASSPPQAPCAEPNS